MSDIDEGTLLYEIGRALSSGFDYNQTQIDGWDYSGASDGDLIIEGTHQGIFFQASFRVSIDWMDA